MNYDYEINRLKDRLDKLEAAFLQSQKNQVPVTAKVDDTANKVVEITPYTQTKTAYIGDTEVVFTGVPMGYMTVFTSGVIGVVANRDRDIVTVSFEPLEEVTTVTISII